MSALRQRPAINRDNAFFFDALKEGRLVAQQCEECKTFRHPPVPMCPRCHALGWKATDIEGTGELISFTVIHHPVVPPFEAGYIVGLVELDHGVRIILNVEADEEDVEIGMTLEVRPYPYDDELVLPAAFLPGSESVIVSSTEGKVPHGANR